MTWLRRNAWWLVPELLVASALVLIFQDRTPSFEDQLAGRAVSILESAPDVWKNEHSQADRVICAAEPFGFEPATARHVDEVDVIYAHFLCAAAAAGTPWDWASRNSGPVVIALSQDPPVVRIAEAGLGYPDRVRAMIPDELEARAFGGFTDPARPAALLRRYQSEIA